MLATNGLKGVCLQVQLMARQGLSWEELKRVLKARSVATHALDVLVGNFDGAISIKKRGRCTM